MKILINCKSIDYIEKIKISKKLYSFENGYFNIKSRNKMSGLTE